MLQNSLPFSANLDF